MDQTRTKLHDVEMALDGDLEPMPDYGDLFKLDDFVDYCKSGYFIDYDGTGYYANETMLARKLPARPSDIVSGKINTAFTHVAWFNR